jgi:hypothetical protein
MTEPTMTKSERDDLARLVRMRAKVAKGQVEQRAAELMAEAEAKLSAIYSFGDEAWADLTATAEAAVAEADIQLAKRCEQLGIPAEFRPRLNLSWYGRGENALRDRRAELRTTARTRVDADAKRAKAAIEASAVDVQTELLADGLTSAAAREFLQAMPTPADLMPALDIGAITQGGA